MIPIIAAAGYRVISPDLVGFGKSDKPANQEDYTYQKHVDWMTALVKELNLRNITLFCQDWGGLIGLRIAAEHEQRLKRIVTVNTFFSQLAITLLRMRSYSGRNSLNKHPNSKLVRS